MTYFHANTKTAHIQQKTTKPDWQGGSRAAILSAGLAHLVYPGHLHGFEHFLVAFLGAVVEAVQAHDPIEQIGEPHILGIDVGMALGQRDGDVEGIAPFHGLAPQEKVGDEVWTGKPVLFQIAFNKELIFVGWVRPRGRNPPSGLESVGYASLTHPTINVHSNAEWNYRSS
jgi:hypothetical protein